MGARLGAGVCFKQWGEGLDGQVRSEEGLDARTSQSLTDSCR